MEQLKKTAVRLVESYLDLQASFEEQVGVAGTPCSAACSLSLQYRGVEALLQQQATTLGLNAAVLATQHVAATLLRAVQLQPQQPCQQLLSDTTRHSVTTVLLLAEYLQDCLLFAHSHFTSRICKSLPCLPLEVLWMLHIHHLLPLQSLLESEWQRTIAFEYLVPSLVEMSCGAGGEAVMQGLGGALVQLAFRNSKPSEGVAPLCKEVIRRVVEETYTAKNYSPTGYSLCHAVMDSPSISKQAADQFFSFLLTSLVAGHPSVSAFSALGCQQQQWSSAALPANQAALFSKVVEGLGYRESLRLVQQQVSRGELCWSAMLGLVACLLHCGPEAVQEMKAILCSLAASAVLDGHAPTLHCFLLLSRQCALEGTHIFPAYQDHFKRTLGDSVSSVVSTRKALQFVLRVLTELVPQEPAAYLKAHIARPPRCLAKCWPLINEYTSLARARLHDLRESLPDAGDISSNSDETHMQEAMEDVQLALESFGRSGKLPPVILRASIFKRHDFVGSFLPALLCPQPPSEGEGVRQRLIQTLARENKIPPRMLARYEQACQEVTGKGHSPCEGRPLLSTTGSLLGLLQELQRLVGKGEGMARVARVLSKLSFELEALANSHRGAWKQGKQAVLDLQSPGLQSWAVEAVDTVLKGVCETVVIQCSSAGGSGTSALPAESFMWLDCLIQMLAGHSLLHLPLYTRLWELLHLQAASLSPPHLLGLAVFCSTLYCQPQPLHTLRLTGTEAMLKTSVDYSHSLVSGLRHRTSSEMLALLRFACHFAHHSLAFTRASPERNQDSIPYCLAQKMKYVHGRYQFLEQMPHLLSEPASRRVQTEVSELLQAVGVLQGVAEFARVWNMVQVPFAEWLSWELAVEVSVSDSSSQDYLWHTLQQSYLPLPPEDGGLGCAWSSAFGQILGEVVAMETGSGWNRGVGLLQSVAACLLAVGGVTTHPCLQQAIEDVLIGNDTCEPAASGAQSKEQRTQSCLRVVCSLPAYLLFRDSASAAQCPSVAGLENLATLLQQAIAPHTSQYFILSCALTRHILQGLCSTPSSVHSQFLDCSPLFHASLICHWPELQVLVKHSNLCPSLASQVAAVHSWLRSDFQDTPPGLEEPPGYWTEVLGVSVFHWLVTTQSQASRLLVALACSAAQEVLVVLCDCCVRELATNVASCTLSTAEDSTTEQRLREIAQLCLTHYPPAVQALKTEGAPKILRIARKHFAGSSSPFSLFRILQDLPTAVFTNLAREPCFLPACVAAHRCCMELSAEPTHPEPALAYQALSARFLRECTELTHKAIQCSPVQQLKVVEPLCHSTLQPLLHAQSRTNLS